MILIFRTLLKDKLCLIKYSILISFFLSCSEQKNSLPDPLEAGWNNEAVCEILQDNADIRALKCTFPPGVGHERHYHKAHFGYAIAGSKFRIKDTTGTREVTLKSGTSFSSEGVEWHEVLNIGDSTAIFLIIEPK